MKALIRDSGGRLIDTTRPVTKEVFRPLASLERKHVAAVDRWASKIRHIKIAEVWVLAVLASAADKHGFLIAYAKIISEACEASTGYVRSIIKRLEARGLVCSEQVYHLDGGIGPKRYALQIQINPDAWNRAAEAHCTNHLCVKRRHGGKRGS